MIDQAVSRGIVLVAAAGNAGPEAPPAYLAAYGVDVMVPAPGNREARPPRRRLLI